MALAIGPCMFVAPLVFLLGLLLVPLWPVAIVVMAVVYGLVWPVEHVLTLCRVRWLDGASRRVGRWLKIVTMPWILFEPLPPPAAPAANKEAPPEGTA